EIDESLKRLRTDYIDIYQIHWPDPLEPIEETAEIMSMLLEQGKIRAIGVSNFSPEQMELFSTVTEIHSCQPPYNLFERGIEKDILPYCKEKNITMLLYGAICRGLLSGKLKIDTEFTGDDLRNIDPKFKKNVYGNYLLSVEKLNDFAKIRFNKNVLQLSVRWVLDICQNDISLWGARKPEQLKEVPELCRWKIDRESMQEIDEILNSTIQQTIGPEFMAPGPRPEV
ncbi:MAG: aldo/keto reductase, partial [Thermodesulfobacteriota bacterium]